MKIISKIKKIIFSAGIAIMTLPKKIFATINVTNIMNATDATLYGVTLYKPSDTVVTIWKICKYFLIPLMIIMGTIIYWKKSKVETKKKVIRVIIAILGLITFGSIIIVIIEEIIDPNGLAL